MLKEVLDFSSTSFFYTMSKFDTYKTLLSML